MKYYNTSKFIYKNVIIICVAIIFYLIFNAKTTIFYSIAYSDSNYGPNYVEINNLDASFPVKVHMIANKTSGNSFILESDNEFAIVDSGEDEDYTPGIVGGHRSRIRS